MRQHIKAGLPSRIALTVYYGFVCSLAIRRCALLASERMSINEPTYWQTALYAAFALSSWWLLREFPKASDRVAIVLFGLFYATKVGATFVKGPEYLVPVVAVECLLISVGMVAMIVGLILATYWHRPPGDADDTPQDAASS